MSVTVKISITNQHQISIQNCFGNKTHWYSRLLKVVPQYWFADNTLAITDVSLISML